MTIMSGLKEQKKQLRKKIKEKLAALSMEYCRFADRQIDNKVISLEAYQNAKVVFCYVGTKEEINTNPILEDILKSSKRLGVPKCISYGVIEVYEITSLDELQPGAYGILEPIEGCRLIEPKEIEFAVIPCLSCSKDGKRLGYGGGFYDRYLPKLSCKKAVLCRSALLEEDIPVDEFDIRIEIVVTDE